MAPEPRPLSGVAGNAQATIGVVDPRLGSILKLLFETPHFKITVVYDAPGVEICGALKNIVALGAGFVDGLGCGGNTKAAIIRIGLSEMMRFAQRCFPAIQARARCPCLVRSNWRLHI